MSIGFARIVVVHGYGAGIDDHWFPWVAEQAPNTHRVELPDADSPNAEKWIALAVDAIGPLRADTAVVAHSVGSITAARAIQQLAVPGAELGGFIAVAPFAERVPLTGDPGLDAFITDGLVDFFDGADLAAASRAIRRAAVVRSDDDPLVPARCSDEFAAAVGAEVTVVPGAGHFLADDGVTQLEPVLSFLRDQTQIA